MPDNVPTSASFQWLISELNTLKRDFGLNWIMMALAELEKPEVSQLEDQIFQAYTVLDSDNGRHNVVSLADLRRRVPVDRRNFDQCLYRIVTGHKMALVPNNHFYRMTADEQQACFKYGAERYLFVSRVHAKPPTARPTEIHEVEPKEMSLREAKKTFNKHEHVEIALSGD